MNLVDDLELVAPLAQRAAVSGEELAVLEPRRTCLRERPVNVPIPC
jgi:hypothetical protein